MIGTVEQIMVKDVYEIDASQSLQDAKKLFKKYNIRHVPVMSGTNLVGMLSRTDVMRLSFGDTYAIDENEDQVDATLFDALSIHDVMTHSPKVISPSNSIQEIVEILIEKNFNAFPVCDDETLVGILTTTDIIQFLFSQLTSNKIPEKKSEKRQWGSFEQFCKSTPCSVKLLSIDPDHVIGFQYHREINKYWKILQGEGIIRIDEMQTKIKSGDEFIISANTKHSLKSKQKSLQVLEICYGENDKKDTVRIIEEVKEFSL